MGRKRTSNKKNLNLWIDKDLLKQLKELDLNLSVLFTDTAKELLTKIDTGEINITDLDKN